jgi:hypothetical protein
LFVAGYFGWKAWQDTQAANRNEEAIESYGCVAHLLKASDLKDYVRQVGADTAAAEITFALENGYRVTTAAIDFLESRGVDVDALLTPALPAAKAKEAETPESEPEPTEAETEDDAPEETQETRSNLPQLPALTMMKPLPQLPPLTSQACRCESADAGTAASAG